MAERVSWNAVAAMALLKAQASNKAETVYSISGLLLNPVIEPLLEDCDFGLRYVPGGVYSEDVDSWLCQLSAVGYARRKDDGSMEMWPEGLRICLKILCEEAKENPGSIETLASAKVLNFGITDLLRCLTEARLKS